MRSRPVGSKIAGGAARTQLAGLLANCRAEGGKGLIQVQRQLKGPERDPRVSKLREAVGHAMVNDRESRGRQDQPLEQRAQPEHRSGQERHKISVAS